MITMFCCMLTWFKDKYEPDGQRGRGGETKEEKTETKEIVNKNENKKTGTRK